MYDIRKSAIHTASWFAGFLIVYYITLHSSVRVNYGIISGWWMACYIGYIVNIRVSSIPSAFFFYFFVAILFFLSGLSSFYHDGASELDLLAVLIILMQGVAFISPILVNEVIKKVMGMYSKSITKA